MTSRAKTGLVLAFCTSLGVHGVAYASLGKGDHEPPPRDFVSEISIEIKPLPPPIALPEPPTTLPEPAPMESIEQAAAAKLTRAAPSTKSATATLAPSTTAPSPALDLSGVTLTNDTGTGFAMPVGDGSALHGPLGLGGRASNAARSVATAAAVAAGPALVPASDLSVHPSPPALAGLLRANYPEAARERGLRGAASVRARIDADGVVRIGRVVSETAAGFGAACRRTVVGSHWSAPRDKNGGAVATEIVYTCHFEVDQ